MALQTVTNIKIERKQFSTMVSNKNGVQNKLKPTERWMFQINYDLVTFWSYQYYWHSHWSHVFVELQTIMPDKLLEINFEN